ncbi:ABC transporter substrate-binding protein [Streptomyces sp. NPDC050617]|uniref:ABC transporter substrate-binding protein n=1 Tax=Streptomyces sp. NPDC050617 TaxID=3154628 RepID=UPI00342DDD9D
MAGPAQEDNTTFISESYGATHTGEGTQFNLYMQQATSRLGDLGGSPRLIARDEREWLDRRFIEPDRYGQARDMLRDHGSVLLGGGTGSGRRAAAVMLLHRSPGTEGSLHELPDTQDDKGSQALDTSVIGAGDRLLLDLSNSDEARYIAVQNELSAFRAVLNERAARLVVVLPAHFGYLQGPGQRQFTVEIGRPSGHEVLMRYLRVDRVVFDRSEVDSVADLQEYLLHEPMREIARLADRIRMERDDSHEKDDAFPQWCARALGAVTDRTPEVADFIAKAEGRQRALALSLAMLHGRRPDAVFRATESLLKAISHPTDERPRLEHLDLTAQFKGIGAETQPDGMVRFRIPAYAQAIRTHFWTYFPDVRTNFRNWVRDCVLDPAFGAPERAVMVPHFAEQGLRTDRPPDLLALAERWTHGGAVRLMPDTVQLLAVGLRHERHGRAFRRQIYDWSLDPHLTALRRRVLVVVCSKVMSETHPDQALVRLHHLARRERPAKENPALDALLALAAGDGRLFRLLLDRLEPGRWPRDAVVFYALADHASRTRALYSTVAVRERLMTGWAAVFRHRSREEWSAPARGWLAAAGALVGGRGEQLLDVLARAAAGRPGTPGRLHVLFRDWAYPSPERAALVSRFDRALDAAQGIEPVPLGT